MKDYTEKITDFISLDIYTPVRKTELFKLLSETDDVTGEEYYEFKKSIDVLEACGVVYLTKNGKVMLSDNAGCVKGSFISSGKGYGFVEYSEEGVGGVEKIFIPANRTMGAIYGDRVLVTITNHATEDGRSREGRVVRILERTLTHIVGTVQARRNRFSRRQTLVLEPENKKIGFMLALSNSKVRFSAGDKVEAEITAYPMTAGRGDSGLMGRGRVVTVFGKSSSLEANYMAILSEGNIRVDFPHDVIAEAKAVSQRPIELGSRLDLRDKPIFTIDSEDAKDLDDAISLDITENGYILGVHIADVSDYVTENSQLDREAALRGTSIYFTDKVVPMLPKELSNGICSLSGGVDRLALSAFIELDKNGHTLGCEIKETLIRSCVRGVYSEINDLLDLGGKSRFYSKYSHVYPSVLPGMYELYKKLEANGRARGALEFDTSDAVIILDKNGLPCEIKKRERGISERIIEQFMLCANEAVAGWLYWQNMPCVYRVHQPPAPEKIAAFTTFAHNLGLNTAPLRTKTVHSSALQKVLLEAEDRGIGTTVSYIMLRSLAKARYSATCEPHFGLASERYCHFTSPIRRYPDLSVHRIVKTILHGEADEHKIAALSSFAVKSAKMSSENELNALYAERDIEDLYRMLFMRDKVGRAFEGVISSVTGFGVFVELDNTCEGLVPISGLDGGYYEFDERSLTLSCGERLLALGMRVAVMVEDVNINTRKMELSLVEIKSQNKNG